MHWVLLLWVGAAGCAGGLHAKGEKQLAVHGSYAHSDPHEPFPWEQGSGSADNAGVTVSYHKFLHDRVSIGAFLTPYRIYNQSDGDIYGVEFQLGFRGYFWQIGKVAFYGDVLGGLTYTAKSVPEDRGSHTNFTQDMGLGFEALLTETWSVFGGYHLSHLSNGGGASADNPSQNDHEFYFGVAYSW